MRYILFNPISNAGKSSESLGKLQDLLKEDFTVLSVLVTDAKELVRALEPKDEIILVGGDGTLNHFINDVEGICPKNNVYLWASGTGNDFLKDINRKAEELVLLNDYLKDLPVVTVNGEKRYFINGIGYGIDGFCCEEADKMRAKHKEKINYTAIAIKGLIYKFHRKVASVEVDGVKLDYKWVWLAPTMKGRYFGGGMMIAPDQDRLAEDHSLTSVVFTGKSKFMTLLRFPKIFEGAHVNFKNTTIRKGHSFKVKFTKPCALQVDGETYLNVLEYEVKA